MAKLVVINDASIAVDGELLVEGKPIHAGDDDEIVRMELAERQKELAVKYFTRELPNKCRDWTRIERVRTLENPHIVHYYYAGSLTQNRVGLLMDYYPRGDLDGFDGSFTLSQSLQIAHEILHGIAFLHGNGIAHGNLCASTILLNQCDEREYPFPKITGIERVPPIVKHNATVPDTSKDMKSATAADFEEQRSWNMYDFGGVLWELWKKISYGNLRPQVDLKQNPYYTQDTLPRLAKMAAMLDDFLPRAPPGIVDLTHLCLRMHSYERPTAQELMEHYIFAMDVPHEQRERERLARCMRYLGTEYFYSMAEKSDRKQYYTKFERINRIQESDGFYITTVDHAVGKFGKRLIWESIFPCITDHSMPADKRFLDKLYAFRNKEMLRFCGLQHQSIFPLLQCHLRYIHDYIGVVYQFDTAYEIWSLDAYLERMTLPWNYIKIYCRQLLAGLIFLEEKGLHIQGICAYMVALCSRHKTGTFLQAKLYTTFYLDELLMETFAKQNNKNELLRKQRRVGRFLSPEAVLLPSISGLLHATGQQQVWGMGHILLQMATSGELQFEKFERNIGMDDRIIADDMSNEEVMQLLRNGWRPKVPATLADSVRRLIKLCFREKDERPSLQELATDEFFRTAMPLEAVVNSTVKPVFCMRPLTVAEMEAIGDQHITTGAKTDEAQYIIMTQKGGDQAIALSHLLQYRNFDCDRPIAIELHGVRNFKQLTFSPANDLIVDLTVSGMYDLDCEVFTGFNLPNLLSLRFQNCQDLVLGAGCLQMFPKLRCLEVPECTFIQFDENVLRETPQLEMLVLDENPTSSSVPALIEQIRCEEKFAGLRQYLQQHPRLIQSRGAGDVWRYQRLTSRPNTGSALDWLGSTSAVCALPTRCIQIGLHGEFQVHSSDVVTIFKVISPNDLGNADYNRELRRLCELKHPNVVSVAIVQALSNGSLTLRMTYYDEVGSLGDFLCHHRTVPPTVPEIAEITHGILLGLEYVHSKDRKTLQLHGSLHPWNVMLEPNGVFFTPKLSDLDNCLQKIYLRPSAARHHHTYSRYAKWYMSPEMLHCTATGSCNELTGKTDIWSFGRVVLYLFRERDLIAKETKTVIHTFDINSNMFYPVENRQPFFTNGAVPPAIIDLLNLTHKKDPRDRPDAPTLLRHLAYRTDLSLENRLLRQVRTDIMPILSSCICPPILSLRRPRPMRNENATAVEICKEWIFPSLCPRLESKDIARPKLYFLAQHMLIKSEAIIEFVRMDLQPTNVLRFSGCCYFSPGDISLRWHLEKFSLSMTEIRTYCIDILNGLQYLRDTEVKCEPVTTDSVYLCNQHSFGIYQTAKIAITPSLLGVVGPDKRFEMLSHCTNYAFAPEEISGYSDDQIHATNIWHFGQILMEMAQIHVNGYSYNPNYNSEDTRAVKGASRKLMIPRNQSVLNKIGVRPSIPRYFPESLERVLQRCFAQAVHRPTANQLQSFADIRESFFYCSPDIKYKVLYNGWPRFSRRLTSVDEIDEWMNSIICRTAPNVNQLPAEKLMAGIGLNGYKFEMALVLFQLRNVDRDHPITVLVCNQAAFSRSFFSPVSDVVVKLVIRDIANFDCRLLRDLHLYNLLSLRFKNCTGIHISQGDLDGFPRLRTLKFARSTIQSFDVRALIQLDYLCNLDLTGDLCLQQTNELEDYMERLLSSDSFQGLREFSQRHRTLIQAKDILLLHPYRAHNLGHLDFLL